MLDKVLLKKINSRKMLKQRVRAYMTLFVMLVSIAFAVLFFIFKLPLEKGSFTYSLNIMHILGCGLSVLLAILTLVFIRKDFDVFFYIPYVISVLMMIITPVIATFVDDNYTAINVVVAAIAFITMIATLIELMISAVVTFSNQLAVSKYVKRTGPEFVNKNSSQNQPFSFFNGKHDHLDDVIEEDRKVQEEETNVPKTDNGVHDLFNNVFVKAEEERTNALLDELYKEYDVDRHPALKDKIKKNLESIMKLKELYEARVITKQDYIELRREIIEK